MPGSSLWFIGVMVGGQRMEGAAVTRVCRTPQRPIRHAPDLEHRDEKLVLWKSLHLNF